MAFTFFFRDWQTLEKIVDHLVPFAMGRSKIRIWDAGCASGEEPYTFMILLAEKLGKYSFKNVKVHATDIDISNQFSEIIRKGEYPFEKVRRIPSEMLGKYFSKISDQPPAFRVMDDLRSKILFKRENLLDNVPTASGFSLILCKNVLLHQTHEQRLRIIEMFYDSLLDGGFLAMEQTQKLPPAFKDKFEQVVPNAQIFKKR
ncbi:MAG TPA: CheR family methyltransferase [Bacteroidales bacterium]|nr:CheR family methyltransferase [Bacteroidales bacterium]